MNRRTFVKLLGLAIAAPGAVLGAVKATPPTNPYLTAENLRVLAQQGSIPGKVIFGDALMFVHPRQHYCLKVMAARDKYKHEHWLIRHNLWLEKQGKFPHKDTTGEIGTFGGMRWRTAKN